MNESLDRVLRAVKAQALREAADEWGDGAEGFPYVWLHDRADAIEAAPYTEQETTNG